MDIGHMNKLNISFYMEIKSMGLRVRSLGFNLSGLLLVTGPGSILSLSFLISIAKLR